MLYKNIDTDSADHKQYRTSRISITINNQYNRIVILNNFISNTKSKGMLKII